MKLRSALGWGLVTLGVLALAVVAYREIMIRAIERDVGRSAS